MMDSNNSKISILKRIFRPVLQQLGLYLSIFAPFLALSAIGGLVNGYLYVEENRYFGQGLHYIGTQFILAQVNRDLFFALLSSLALFVAVILFLKRFFAVISFLPYLYAIQLCLLVSRLIYFNEWTATIVRFGLPLPSIPLRKHVICGILFAFVLPFIFVRLVNLYRKGRAVQAGGEWPSPKFVRRCVWMSLVAFGVGLTVNLAAWLVPLEKPPKPFNIIFITWDSTRADHLSCYGYSRSTSPNLDAFAQDAVLFETAISQYNWTRPSYASIFTSLNRSEFPRKGLSLSQLTLAEVLKDKGYHTFGYVQNPNLDRQLFFNQGFDSYVQLRPSTTSQLMNHFVMKRINSLSRLKEPFFLFIHYEEPHNPYRLKNPFIDEFVKSTNPPLRMEQIKRLMVSHGEEWDPIARGWDRTAPDAEEKVQYIKDLYDADIRITDEAMGEILDVLKEKGLWENSLIIFNSDHGDEFNDRGQFGHSHKNLHPELTFVPLVIHFPKELGISPGRVSIPAQNLDIFPTVLGVTGIPLPQHISGLNLLPIRELDSDERMAFSIRTPCVMLRNSRHALRVDYEKGSVSFYNLLDDPEERYPLLNLQENTAFLQMKAKADLWYTKYSSEESKKKPGDNQISKELKQRLKALGYIQ